MSYFLSSIVCLLFSSSRKLEYAENWKRVRADVRTSPSTLLVFFYEHIAEIEGNDLEINYFSRTDPVRWITVGGSCWY